MQESPRYKFPDRYQYSALKVEISIRSNFEHKNNRKNSKSYDSRVTKSD